MKRFHRYIPESPELLAAREAEERTHVAFLRWRFLACFCDCPVRFAPEAK